MPPVASAYPDARERTAPPYPVHAPPFGGHKVRPHMPAPPAFTDEQIDAIMRAAAPLAPDDRTLFLEAVVAALDWQTPRRRAGFPNDPRDAAPLAGPATVGRAVGRAALATGFFYRGGPAAGFGTSDLQLRRLKL